MRKYFLHVMVVLLVVLVCSACNEDKKEIEYGDAKIIEFGFYKNSNIGMSSDYKGTIQSDGNIIVVYVPNDVDKTKLVAYFITTKNDVVTVEGVNQVSGVTENDFSKPLKYVVAEGTSKTVYTVKLETKPDEKAEIEEFGFYKDKNPHLKKDYVGVIDKTDNNTITILLPDYIDRSRLIASFKLSYNDTVRVEDIEQVSGVTENDFSIPVDYIVSDGDINSLYIVKIEDMPDAIWEKEAHLNSKLYSMVMKVNHKDNLPYLVYVNKDPKTSKYKSGMYKLQNNSLVKVGNVFLNGKARYSAIAFNEKGIPFVAFCDYTIIENKSINHKLSVMYYDNSSWKYVGGNAGKGLTDDKVLYNDIAIKSDGNPIVASMNGNTGVLAKRELNISEFNGQNWTTSITIPGRDASQYSYYPKIKIKNDVIYIAVLNVNDGSISAYKKQKGNWITIFDKYIDVENGATTAYYRDFDFDLDSKDNIYIAIGDDQSGKNQFKPKVKKYDVVKNKWSTIASPIDVKFSSTRYFSLCVSPYDVPFLLYRNESLFPTVVKLNKKTQQWSTPVVLENVASDNLYIDFTPNNIGYIAYENTDIKAIEVWKYDASVKSE